jgi:hypothetical protein
MGMPCEINNIIKLSETQGHPSQLLLNNEYQAAKSGYRILPVDVPVLLVDENWMANADIIVSSLTWSNGQTVIKFKIDRVFPSPFCVKEPAYALK